MSKKIKIARPEGHHSITAGATVRGAAEVVRFVEEAFGGEVVDRYEGPGGTVMHAEVKVGDSVFMLGEAHGEGGPMPATLSLYVDDADAVDATYQKALAAGAKSVSEPAVQPWGWRSACVTDAGGNRWTVCTVVEELSHDEIERRMQG